MTTPIKYRISSTATKPVSDTVKGAPLTSLEIDGNFRSIKDSIELIQSAYLPAGYSAPVDYVAGVILSSATQTVAYQGEVYAPKAAEVPFTTSGTFEVAKFVQIQPVASVDLAASGGAGLVGVTPVGGVAATSVQAAIAELDSEKASLAALASGNGAGLVGYLPAGAGAVATTVQNKLREAVSVLDFMTDTQKNDVLTRTTTIPVSAAVQKAIDYLPATGGEVYMPKGRYLWDTPVKTRNGVAIVGEGDATEILVNDDIGVFNSDVETVSSAVFGAVFRDIFINKTVSGATTKYDIHLQNPNFCNLTRVHVKSGHDDTQYSSTNVGGVFLERPAGSTSAAYCNRVDNCWIQNNSIYFCNLTDSVINGGFVWGHTRQFSIRIQGGVGGIVAGAIAVENVVGIIPSKHNGAIWLDGASLNQIRIHANEFDGNPALDTGYGILCLQSALAVTVTGNTFWGCDYHSIWAKDPVGWTITGNNFFKGGARDDLFVGYDDIRLESTTFAVNGNTISGNTHLIDVPRTNPGFAVRMMNSGGGLPFKNSIVGNTVNGSYQGNGFSLIGNDEVVGNVGVVQMDDQRTNNRELRGQVQNGFKDFAGLSASINDIISPSGTIDLVLNSTGGYVGHLYVSTTRVNFTAQSRRSIYTIAGYGSTATITNVVQHDGPGGGSAFTLSMSSAGVVRLTDTSSSGSQIAASMTFHGTLSLA